MSSLSNDYTAIKTWREAVRELPDADNITFFDKFDVLNRAQAIAQGLVPDVVAESYMTDLVPVFDNTGKYGTAAMSYVVATRTLSVTMSTNFSSTDEGKWVDFRSGSTTYGGYIQTYISVGSVIIQGDNLPSIDIASTDISVVANGSVTVLSTTPSGDTINISAARILRYGTQERIKLLSTATNYITLVSDIEYQQWITTADYNRLKIVWNLSGVAIYLKRGSGLSNYGTFTFRYPRLPNILSTDTDQMDVLDGTMIQLTIGITRNLIAKRLGAPEKSKDDLAEMVQSIYRELTGEVKLTKDSVMSKINGLV